jgi:hypothetical protein
MWGQSQNHRASHRMVRITAQTGLVGVGIAFASEKDIAPSLLAVQYKA